MHMKTLEDSVIEIERALCETGKGAVYKSIMEMVERPVIKFALARTAGNQVRAARMLGINRNTIRSKVRRLGISTGKRVVP